jgi:hypothetical protein
VKQRTLQSENFSHHDTRLSLANRKKSQKSEQDQKQIQTVTILCKKTLPKIVFSHEKLKVDLFYKLMNDDIQSLTALYIFNILRSSPRDHLKSYANVGFEYALLITHFLRASINVDITVSLILASFSIDSKCFVLKILKNIEFSISKEAGSSIHV